MSTKINVTQQDINVGTALREVGKRCLTCPVALAMQRDWFPTAVVGGTTYGRHEGRAYPLFPITVNDSLGVNRKPLPLKVQRFIKAFDDMRPVGPISFWV